MNRSLLWILATMALALAACSGNRQPKLTPNLQAPSKPDTLRACPRTRWIAILSPGVRTCPEAPGFQAKPLFGPRPHTCVCPLDYAADSLPIGTIERPPSTQSSTARCGAASLDRYCVYEATAPSPDPNRRPAPQLAPADVRHLDPDCQGAAAMGSWLEEKTREGLESQFLNQVGQTALGKIENGESKVRIAFIDSEPDGVGVPALKRGCSPHGFSLAHMSKRMLCNEGRDGENTCAAQFSTRLALKVHPADTDVQQKMQDCEGGLVGYIGDLAAAIQAEVDDWADHRVGQQRLILNLSVGWDGQLFGGLEEPVCEMSAPIQAVYSALQDARAKGVLVIAAAGNATFGPEEHRGPILPAAWEDRLPEQPCGAKATQPLVYAAGGVRWDGSRLFNARPGATPPRLAYSDHAVVSMDRGGHTATLTGTSVSAAVISSAAALAWGQDPTLDPPGVIKALEETAQELGFKADFGAAKGQLAKRVCLGKPCSKDRFTATFDLKDFKPGWRGDGTELEPVHSSAPRCKGGEILASRRPTTSFCPSDEAPSANLQPWVCPQPENDPCPNCAIKPPAPAEFVALAPFSLPLAGAAGSAPCRYVTTLLLDVPDEWWQGTDSLRATTLELIYDGGNRQIRRLYSIGKDLSNGRNEPTSLKVTNLEVPQDAAGKPLPIVSAVVNFLITREGNTMSVFSPLFLPAAEPASCLSNPD
jgi:hypothetical protein